MSREEVPAAINPWATIGPVLVWAAMQAEDGRTLRDVVQFVQGITGADPDLFEAAQIAGTSRHVFEPRAEGLRVDRDTDSARSAAQAQFFPTLRGDISRAQLAGLFERQMAIDEARRDVDEQEARLRDDMRWARSRRQDGHFLE